MNLWNRLLGRIQSRSLATPSPWLMELFGGTPSKAGVSVTATTAMQCTASRAAIQAIAEPLGQLPLLVYSKSDDGSKSRDTDHPVYRLLHDQANAWTTAGDMREQITRDALLHGNGYVFINRTDDEPQELIRLSPTQTTIEIDEATGQPSYKYQSGTGEQLFHYRDVIHIKAPSLDGYSGDSPVQQCREAIALAVVLENHGSSLFKNGARPGGVITMPGRVDPDTLELIRKGWKAAQEGSDNSGRTAFLFDGAEFKTSALNSVDAQYLELRRFAVEEIGRIFRVPPHLIFEMGRATWGNAGEMGRSFVRFSLMRWVKQWEAQCSLKLFSDTERQTHSAEYLLDDFLRSDLASRADSYSKLIASKIMSPNECRQRENLPPYEGGSVFENPNTTAAQPAQQGDD